MPSKRVHRNKNKFTITESGIGKPKLKKGAAIDTHKENQSGISKFSRFGRKLKLKFDSFMKMQTAKKYSLFRVRFLLENLQKPFKVTLVEEPLATPEFSTPTKKQVLSKFSSTREDYVQGVLSPSGEMWTPEHHHRMHKDSKIQFGTPRGTKSRLDIYVKQEADSNYAGATYLRRMFAGNPDLESRLKEYETKCANHKKTTPIQLSPHLRVSNWNAQQTVAISQFTLTKKMIDEAKLKPRKSIRHPCGKTAGEYARSMGFNDPGYENRGYNYRGRSSFEFAHEKARSHGGSDDASNLFVVTAACNTRMMIAEMFETLLACNPYVDAVHVTNSKKYIPGTMIVESMQYRVEWCDNRDKLNEKYHVVFDFNGLQNDKPVPNIYHYLTIPYQMFLRRQEQLTQEILGSYKPVIAGSKTCLAPRQLFVNPKICDFESDMDTQPIAPSPRIVV